VGRKAWFAFWASIAVALVLAVAVAAAELIGGGQTTLKWTPQLIGDVKRVHRERTAVLEEARFVKADCEQNLLRPAACASVQNFYAQSVESDVNAWSAAVQESVASTQSLSGVRAENGDLRSALAHCESFVGMAADLHRDHGFPVGASPSNPNSGTAPWWDSPEQVILAVSDVFGIARSGRAAAVRKVEGYLKGVRFPEWAAI
jgi:hypothetical protein